LKQENFNLIPPFREKNLRKLRILVAPLDWGLGHATRCIPIIYELLSQDCDVWLAAEGAQEALLKQEFPKLSFLSLKGYRVRYSRSATSMLWNMLNQSRKILRAIKQENSWLKKKAIELDFDAVISDNRYGLYHTTIPCVFITHQLNIKSPLGKWTERLLQKRNYKYINRFTECWVPDAPGENNLAGDLSHPLKKPTVPLHYIGTLTRLKAPGEISSSPSEFVPPRQEAGGLLVILSGPEPQRTILENKILKDIAHYDGNATIVRGLPGTFNLIPSTDTLKFYNHLPAEELNNEMNRAEYIISRSGYSTIMDIIKLQKKSILIPTPGQTEQKYLAKYLQEKKIALGISQNSFSLSSALQSARSFSYTTAGVEKENHLQQTVSQFIRSLSKH
jgi:UDP-N-acetylglucosamine transferase subunit ALG13